MLQRKFVALGGVDMLIHFISMSVNDEVIAGAASALRMLEESSKDACIRVLRMGGASALFVQMRRTRNVQVQSVTRARQCAQDSSPVTDVCGRHVPITILLAIAHVDC